MKDIKVIVDEFPVNAPEIVPLVVSEEYGKTTVEVYDIFKSWVSEYIESYGDKLFSKRSMSAAYEYIGKLLGNTCYQVDTYGKNRYYYQFRKSKKSSHRILPEIYPMSEEFDSLINLTSIFSDAEGRIPPFSYVAVENGKIVSAATVNESSESSSLLEITVSTAPGYRGKGYGSSVVEALSNKITGMGMTAVYSVSRFNKASVRVAMNCSFEKIGRFYAVCAYKTNNHR